MDRFTFLRACRGRWLLALALAASTGAGCAAFPDRRVEPLYHNPFPQLHKVAVLPFYNQSAEPTVDGDAIALAYYNELQDVPGFEVMPVGVAKQFLAASGIEPRTGADFQKLARMMGVDAVLIGSVTEYSPYYPPRVGLAVDWYAANPSYHPIPAGYGLPWGRAEEEYIPSTLVQQAEFELARAQLKTQTPEIPTEREDFAGRRCRGRERAAASSGLARSARVHSASACCHAPCATASIRTDHHAHADLSRAGRTDYRTDRELLLLSR
ncbi:MAG: hypothetical protein MUF06_17205 [Pirellulaceae bacterium]|nr:hypothetical protein [Pirellulaceae bacterium]